MRVMKHQYSVTMDEHHFGAVFKDQVGDPTVGQSDSHQVLTLQRQNLDKQKYLSMSVRTHAQCRAIKDTYDWSIDYTVKFAGYNSTS